MFSCLLFFIFFFFSFCMLCFFFFFFFSSRRRHTRCLSDWSSDVCSSDLARRAGGLPRSCLRRSVYRVPPRNAAARFRFAREPFQPGAGFWAAGLRRDRKSVV